MVKICHLTIVHSISDVRIFKKECVSLAKVGYQVYLVAPNEQSRVIDGIFVRGFSLKNGSKISRIFSSKKEMLNVALNLDAEIYHLHDPELLPLVKKFKKKNKKVIFDSHEDVPALIKSKKWIPFILRKPISIIYSLYEKYVLKKIDAVISVSPHIFERLKKINPNAYLITNYPIINHCEYPVYIKDRNLCFAGLISSPWMHHNIVKALESLDIKYNIAGPDNPDYLNTLKEFSAFSKMNYVGKLPNCEVENFLRKNGIGIALYNYSPELGYNKGTLGVTKLFEYMKAGIPFICTDFILWKKIVEKENCGICINPRNVDEIIGAVQYLLNNPDVAFQMGINGQNAVMEKYNWAKQEQTLFDLYKKIV